MKIMHMGDLHLGAFPGPEMDGENARFKDLQAGLDTLVQQARQRRPDLIIVAGDLFHQAKVWSDRGLREQAVMVRYLRSLMDVASVFVLRGTPNHDSYEQFRTLETTFAGEDRIVFAMDNGLFDMSVGGRKVYLAALPGFYRGLFAGCEPGEDESDGVYYTEKVNEAILQLDALCPKDGSPRLLVGHYTVEGSQTESGQMTFFSNTEPVVRLSTLSRTSFDLLCFGHIHKPQQLKARVPGFYCGSMARLNFNDEGQVRGFYEHDWQGNGQVTSQFVELPCREFMTIDLNDDQIGKIIEGTFQMGSVGDVTGKIVRVRYSCTDAHNKALSTAWIERKLYEADAFWVQEISPVSIQMTAGPVLQDAGTHTPVENLETYLAVKQVDDVTTQRLAALAAPLVQAAQAEKTVRHKTGLFEPVEIKVHNYRNYADASFDYSSVQFCTINGENGTGKSSLFMDAVVDALYEIPREGDLAGWIRNDPAVKSGQIRFTFRLGNEMFRVTRFRRKTGAPSLKLEQEMNGQWTDISKDRVRDTQELIEEILGMDALTFKSCVFIMQDQYGLFLSADPTERMNILGTLLGLGVYDVLEDAAAEQLTQINRQIRELTARKDQLEKGLPDSEKLYGELNAVTVHLSRLEQERQGYQDALKTLQGQINAALSAKDRVTNLNRQQQETQYQKGQWEKQRSELLVLIDQLREKQRHTAEIQAGKARYDDLVQQEKSLLVACTQRKAVAGQVQTAKDQVVSCERMMADQQRSLTSLIQSRDQLNRELEQAASLEQAWTRDRDLEQQLQALYLTDEKNREYMTQAGKLKEDLSRQEADFQGRSKELMSQLQSYRQQAALLENSGCVDPVRASCQFLQAAQKAKQMIPGLEARVRELDQSWSQTKADLEAQIKAVEAQIDTSVAGRIQGIRSQRDGLRSQVDAYAALGQKRGQLDQIMAQIVQAQEQLKQREADTQKAAGLLTSLEQQLHQFNGVEETYRLVCDQIGKEKHWLDEWNELPTVAQTIGSSQERVNELDRMIGQLDVTLQDRQQEILKEQAAVRGLLALQTEANEKTKAVNTLSTQIRQDAEQKGRLTREVDLYLKTVQEIDEFRRELNTQAQLAADYKELKQAFSTDGIRHQIIQTVLPQFEAAASAILSQMSGGQMRIEFVTTYVQKSNKGKEIPTLDIIIDDIATGRLPYKSRSGGERVKAALSVILALAEIKSSSAGVQLGFLGIDEPPYLDAQGAQAYCDALEAIQRRYPDLKVMAITHDPAMKGRFPQSVDVVKTPQGSKVVRS